jgi:predicted nucleic acid-binding protein
MSRRGRSGSITPADLIQLFTRFRLDLRTQYQVVEVTSRLLDEAMLVAEAHALRGYDAVQLAALARHQEGVEPTAAAVTRPGIRRP